MNVGFETFHWRMAFASLSVGLIGAVLVGQAAHPQLEAAIVAESVAGGVVLLAAVAYAAWTSRFWNHVRYLQQPQKSFVWLIAIAGFAIVGIVIFGFAVAWSMLHDGGIDACHGCRCLPRVCRPVHQRCA